MYKNRFTSKRDAMNRAKRTHVCTSCLHNQPTTFKICINCKTEGMRVYFPSREEHIRAVQLIYKQKGGDISQLKFHPRYALVVDGTKICTYVADSSYIENGKQVVEDVKPSRTDFMDAVAKFKISLFDSLNKKHGISVNIYRRG